MKYTVSAQTNVGLKRINNEDNFCVNDRYMPAPAQRTFSLSANLAEGVIAVCDGMGGESYGEYASLTGVKTIAENYSSLLCDDDLERKERADRLIRSINADICAEMQKRKAGIGSTVVLACVKNDCVDVFNVGDSRAYLFRKGKLKQLSKDHTVARQKIDMGVMTEEKAARSQERHQLTQHLGVNEEEMLIEAYHSQEVLVPGDMLLLCSDGLTDMVSNEEISLLCRGAKDAAALASALIDQALENGGKDNVTVIAINMSRGRSS